MYLLHTTNLTLKGFYAKIPEYAILSHTWDEDEVTFQDILDRGGVDWKKISWKKKKAGWKKVEGACAQAQKYHWEWIWIDSCCIDKSSSAELSENINSMYRLYENAAVCYVYLSDASSEEDPRDSKSGFAKSRWFTRGWTLQELIAPLASVFFLDHSWEEIGTRYSLRDVISAITSVPVRLLEDEDRAYSLMGLFDICMSPIYGEGEAKAFFRLQQEIIKTSDDRSIFAWVVDCKRKEDGEVVECESRGLLAKSPDEFKGSGRVGISNASFDGDTSFSFNNNGLHQLVLHSFKTPENVQEVIVKEMPQSRETRRVYNTFDNYVRFLPAAQEHFKNVTFDGESVPSFGFSSSDPFTVKFDCRHSDETVHISFAASKEGGGMLWMASSDSVKMGAIEGACHADRLTMELESGGFVTAAIQITGRTAVWGTREIEINYTTSSLKPTLRCPQSQFIEISDYALRDVFPPNQSDRGPSDERPPCRYLSLSKEASSACRILNYGDYKIAVGINESGEVWVHVPWNIGTATFKELCESYQENGSRAQFKGNTSNIGSYRKVTVYKNNGVQFASHSLVITEQ
ncbi:HET-domain-containing protein [Dendrothele bispora CBS 962.96]|uniref:HET-domain-containing protein n=1 Tax=Dendrothele bispora (strain CBS 962.96) TaxID=1314807 RepID=A0A4S8LLX6_DENBC|nr:HET-domain-containing protein [Dendrothele bispora CBS 962.96]